MCTADSDAQKRAMMFPLQTGGKNKDPSNLPYLKQDLAAFLLTRGPHAFLGHSWLGCSKNYAFPPPLNVDYGEPTAGGLCKESAPNSGIFEREWTKATVKMDCGSYTGSVTMKATGTSVFAD